MGNSPEDSKGKPQPRKGANVVSFEEARKVARARLGQRKEFNIARGALREGALYNPYTNSMEINTKQLKELKRPKLAKPAAKEAAPIKEQKADVRPTVSKPKAAKKGKDVEFKMDEAPRPTVAKAPAAVEQVDRPSAAGHKSRFAARVEAMREVREERRRVRTKAKADKKFDKQYGDADGASMGVGKRPKAAAAAPREGGGPRAAVYEGKMGALHKKASKLQTKGGAHAGVLDGRLSIPSVRLPPISRRMGTTLATVLTCAVCAFSLYGPAQQYYTQMRETDRLQAEYAAVAERSDNLQASIDSLQTNAGVEDKAHADLGYIKSGERTATVKGIDFDNTKEFSTNVVPGSVPAPDTWYSPVLDVLFNYSNSK